MSIKETIQDIEMQIVGAQNIYRMGMLSDGKYRVIIKDLKQKLQELKKEEKLNGYKRRV